jgi:hypothetical protein
VAGFRLGPQAQCAAPARRRGSAAEASIGLRVPSPERPDGYDPADGGVPVPTRSGIVAGHTVDGFDSVQPPIRRLHLATSVSGMVGGAPGWCPLIAVRSNPPSAWPASPFHTTCPASTTPWDLPAWEKATSAPRPALIRDEHWWAAHDHGHPVHPDRVVRAAHIAVLIEAV